MTPADPPALRRPRSGRWPQGPGRLAAIAVLLLILAHLVRPSPPGAFRLDDAAPEEVEAVLRMRQALEVLREERLLRGLAIDPRIDPAGSGLIGAESSPITTTLGNLAAKRTAVQAEWAGILVRMMRSAGVRPGDVVAAGFSGSFPGLNLAVHIAADVIGARVAAITSIGASMWGANLPEWTWLDMEAVLAARGVIARRSIASSPGGEGDRGVASFPDADGLLEEAARRNGVALLAAGDLAGAVRERLRLYDEAAGRWAASIAVYVNVGGSDASLGRCAALYDLAPGLHAPGSVPACDGRDEIPGILSHMGARGVPVIHLLNIRDLALRYGLPVDPGTLAGSVERGTGGPERTLPHDTGAHRPADEPSP